MMLWGYIGTMCLLGFTAVKPSPMDNMDKLDPIEYYNKGLYQMSQEEVPVDFEKRNAAAAPSLAWNPNKYGGKSLLEMLEEYGPATDELGEDQDRNRQMIFLLCTKIPRCFRNLKASVRKNRYSIG